MSYVITDDNNYISIANAIRAKTGIDVKLYPNEMGHMIGEIDGFMISDVTITNGHLIITLSDNTTKDLGQVVGESGRDYVLTETDKGDIAEIMATEYRLQNKTVTPSSTSQLIEADNGYAGLNSVLVNAAESLELSQVKPFVLDFKHDDLTIISGGLESLERRITD